MNLMHVSRTSVPPSPVSDLDRRGTEPLLVFLWAAFALLLTAASLWRFRHFFDDDAFITLRYARNLVEGNGPVWNPGERVEGYTSFLHLMLVSLVASAGISLVTAARIVGMAALAGLFGYV